MMSESVRLNLSMGNSTPGHSKIKEYSKWLLKKKAKALPSGILKINLKNEKSSGTCYLFNFT